jgi:hypothetical protein
MCAERFDGGLAKSVGCGHAGGMTTRLPPKRSPSPSSQPKRRYRVTNWPHYNAALRQRGSLTLWLDRRALGQWQANRTGRRGHPFFYSDLAIQLMLVLQTVYHLPLRQTQGFTRSVLTLLRLRRRVPHYSTLGRRRPRLSVALPRRRRTEGLHLVVDSTGLKVYGDGEWQVKKHGATRRRTWCRLHIGLDEATHELTAVVLTENLGRDSCDHQVFPALIEQTLQTGPIRQVSADGGYDFSLVHRYLQRHLPDAKNTIVPRRNAVIRPDDDSLRARHANIRRIDQVGRACWKRQSGYHRRSLVETAMARFKQLFGPSLSARQLASQTTEVRLRARVLNQMTALGMPETYPIH